jgi:hypothetical protein
MIEPDRVISVTFHPGGVTLVLGRNLYTDPPVSFIYNSALGYT